MKNTKDGIFFKGRFYTNPMIIHIKNDYHLVDQQRKRYPSDITEEILKWITDQMPYSDKLVLWAFSTNIYI